DPWELATILVQLARDKQRLRYELAGLLRRFSEQWYAGTLGYPGFGAYCNERLSFGIRRAQRLIRFRNGLDRFPKLTAAYLAGDISYTAAVPLLSLLHRTTEAAWVTWAKGLTYREVERVTERVRDFAHAKPTDATVFPMED